VRPAKKGSKKITGLSRSTEAHPRLVRIISESRNQTSSGRANFPSSPDLEKNSWLGVLCSETHPVPRRRVLLRAERRVQNGVVSQLRPFLRANQQPSGKRPAGAGGRRELEFIPLRRKETGATSENKKDRGSLGGGLKARRLRSRVAKGAPCS